MRTRWLQLALATATVVLAGAPAASAVTVARDGNTIRIDAAAGERNAIAVGDAGGMLRVVEANNGAGATISPGAGCANSVANSVDCGASGTVTDAVVTLGDGDDDFGTALGFPVTVDAGAGQDLVNGNNGNDTLTGGTGNDDVDGFGGSDAIDGGDGNDSLTGGLGNDSIQGGSGDDSLQDAFFFGLGAGDDTMDGGDGNDFIDAGPGTDQQLGGSGDDTLMSQGVLEGADLVDGGPGSDGAFATNDGVPMSISLDGVANDGADGQGANLRNLEFVGGGSANDTITGSSGPEYLEGSGGNDVVDGLGGGDEVRGSSGEDVLRGGDGSDFVYGGNDADILSGEAGADMVYGQRGADDMSGGAGRDTVNFGNGSAYDAATVTLDNVANDGAAGEGDNARSDNENILGTGGNDFLIGGPGVNTIDGGEGDDVIVTADGGPGAASRDHALCGRGEDTVRADPLDFIGEKEEHCEFVQYADLAGWGPDVIVSALVPFQIGLPLQIGCPFRARGGCEGTVRLRVGGRSAGRVRFSLEAGGTADREMRLSRRVRRALARGRRVRGSLVTTVRDEIGATKTSTKSVTLKR